MKEKGAAVRYFFNVLNRHTYRDETGYFFASQHDAIDYAEIIAREFAKEPDLRNSFVDVIDEQGKEVAKVSLRTT